MNKSRQLLVACGRKALIRRAALLVLGVFGSNCALAYVGPSFMDIPGIEGNWQGEQFRNWLKVDVHRWETRGTELQVRITRRTPKMHFSYPFPPSEGSSSLTIALAKTNPIIPRLMAFCTGNEVIPELTYAESSRKSRPASELGPIPEVAPEYFEYKLKDVTFKDCPVVEGAPEQAFLIAFDDIEWLNFEGEGYGEETTLEPAVLKPLRGGGQTRAYVVTWFAVAHDISDNQCAALNEKPSQEEFYAYMSDAEAAKKRAALAVQGGPNYENGEMERRGPAGMNVCLLPGIVPDTGHRAPQSKLARGLDLDRHDGVGEPPAGVCPHRNYLSADGRSGIDNQLYTVEGCIPGFQGHKGFLMQYRNEQMRNGLLSILLVVTGIDDEQNDDKVDVSILYSKDPMQKNASGTRILPDYTFRLTDNPEYTHYFSTLSARIENGVIITERVDLLRINPGLNPQLDLYDAGMRLGQMEDGSIKGVLAGYQDWKRIVGLNGSSNLENLYGYQCPGIYNAYKRAADGLADPVTGECNGISSAYDIEAVPAFLPRSEVQALVKGRLENLIGSAR